MTGIETNRPSVSVVVRSFNRLEACVELLEALVAQDYPDFEIVVVEQTTEATKVQKERFAAFVSAHSIIRVLHRAPIGPAGARTEGWKHAHNEIILYIDDDDLPLGNGWITAHARNFSDPDIIGVSGRDIYFGEEFEFRYRSAKLAHKRCLSYSLLGCPYTYARYHERIDNVMWLRGGNASVRRLAIEAAGGWDTSMIDHEEHSFAFRLKKIQRPGQRLVFDPAATIVRRNFLHGGLGRRWSRVKDVYMRNFRYYHHIIGSYRTRHFIAFYPIYPPFILAVTLYWLWNDSLRHSTIPKKILTTFGAVAASPAWFLKGWWRLLSGSGLLKELPAKKGGRKLLLSQKY